MNDIDRSVDSFDFAMRRRFRFVELEASKQLGMLDSLKGNLKEEAKERMDALNKAILDIKELNSNYQIGAAYFLKLNNLTFDELWDHYLKPLLQEYVRGMYNESKIMEQLKDAYDLNFNNNKTSTKGETDESGQN
jgi:5-methylcytosine-specific restriction endonuclease McrBC GTP-binding regulatory subunit McrB